MKRSAEELKRELGGLSRDIQPPRDLWPDIAARLSDPEATGGGGDGSGDGLVRPISTAPGWNPLRRYRVPVEWAVAASVALATVVGATIWVTMRAPTTDSAPTPVAVTQEPQPAAFAGVDLSEYEAAAADLQAVLEAGSELLEPETLEVLEQSLLAIDSAIAEARAALEADPGHEGLQRLLNKNHRRKLDLLRHAAAAVQSRT